MNFGEMQEQIRLMLGETDSDNSYFTDTEIKAQINRSLIRVASDIPCLLTYKEDTTTASTQRYGLPTDFLQLKDVQLYPSATRRKQLLRLEYDEFEYVGTGNVTMTGEPAYYRVEFGAVDTVTGSPPGDLWLYPIPNGTYTIRVVYFQKPTAMTADAEVTELPEFMHEAVNYHAAWHVSLKDGNQKKVGNLAAMYKDAITEAKRTIVRRDRTGPKQSKTSYGRSSLVDRYGGVVRRGPIR